MCFADMHLFEKTHKAILYCYYIRGRKNVLHLVVSLIIELLFLGCPNRQPSIHYIQERRQL